MRRIIDSLIVGSINIAVAGTVFAIVVLDQGCNTAAYMLDCPSQMRVGETAELALDIDESRGAAQYWQWGVEPVESGSLAPVSGERPVFLPLYTRQSFTASTPGSVEIVVREVRYLESEHSELQVTVARCRIDVLE